MSTRTQGRQWTIFFVYTLWSVVLIVAMVPFVLAIVVGPPLTEGARAAPLSFALIAVQTVLGAWSARAALRGWVHGPAPLEHGRWDLPRVGVLDARPWTAGAVVLPSLALVILLVLPGSVGASAWPLLISLGVLTVSALIRVPWWWSLLAAIALALLVNVLEPSPGVGAPFAAIVTAATAAVRSSLWLAALVRELEDARMAQSQLAVAEERMRFARDLHDVSGRDLSAIAVKSELVAQLVERGDDRALEHSREAAQIARTSLAEIRALVRGYREVNLEAELQGTVSLLRSARVEVNVQGSAEEIPDRHDQVAEWVLREGGTNILRHSEPRHVIVSLAPEGIRLSNDGAPQGRRITEGSGLTGLRERLGADAVLTAVLDGDVFTLEVKFSDSDAGTDDPAAPGTGARTDTDTDTDIDTDIDIDIDTIVAADPSHRGERP